MQHWQFSLRSLFAVTALVALASGFAQQVGIMNAAKCGAGPTILAVGLWLMASVPSETRGRIRMIPVVVGAIAGVSLAGLFSILLCSLNAAAVGAPGARRFDHPDTDIVGTWTLIGSVLGLVSTLLSSWHWTRARLTTGGKPNTGSPQCPASRDHLR